MKIILKFCLLAIMLLFLYSCSTSLGYGVVLWADKDSGLKNGEVVNILSDSTLNYSFLVKSKNKKENILVPYWRLEIFNSRKEAVLYTNQFKPFLDMYVYSEKDGIPPIREEMSNSANAKIVYKFKAKQPAKVLSRTEEKVMISNMEDYWYYILLENKVPLGDGKFKSIGIKGYCFGYSLKLITADTIVDSTAQMISAPKTDDEVMDHFFRSTWVPISYQEMNDKNRIDLKLFKAGWGLFPDQENKKVRIVTDKVTFNADFKQMTKIDQNKFSFPESSLRIEFLETNKIVANFSKDGVQTAINFAALEDDLSEIIDKENERRSKLFDGFSGKGKTMNSSTYGEITIQSDKTFTWTDFRKLVPSIIPETAKGEGTVALSYYLNDDLKSDYNGVITFNFAGAGREINFLYQSAENGLKFLYIENNTIKEMEVSSAGSNQVILFFKFVGN